MAVESTGYWIPIRTAIFAEYEKLKDAIWLLLWLVDKTTREVNGGNGTKLGIVLGHRPIPDSEPAAVFGVSTRTVRRWRKRLGVQGHILQERAAEGYRIVVVESQKWGSRKVSGGT
jgi:hypothetical protein